MLLLHEVMQQAARAAPARVAVGFEGRTITYGELSQRAGHLAGFLASVGCDMGDRVAIWTENRLEFPEVLFGIAQAGGVAVPLDFWWTPEEAVTAIEMCGPRAIFAATAQAELLEPYESRLEAAGVAVRVVFDAQGADGWAPYELILAEAPQLRRALGMVLDDPALILFTSGSTGRSKGAVHTHRSLASTAIIMALELGVTHGERTLHFLPMFSSCLEHLIPLTLVRGTHIVLPGFDAYAVWETIDREKITHFDAVPTTLRRLIEAHPARTPKTLQRISYASEPMPLSLLSALQDWIPGASLVQFYGMIEQLCLTVLGPSEHAAKPHSVGRAMMGARLRIVDSDGESVGAGNVGEVVASTPTLMAGYFRDSESTARVTSDGWMRTGDLAFLGEDGFLVLQGRLKEVIKSGGMTVVPREVEETLLSHPAVREAAVLGRPDAEWGEAVLAFVVLAEGATVEADDLRRYCRQRAAAYKCPQAVYLVDSLPRTGIGKVAKRLLATEWLERNPSGLR